MNLEMKNGTKDKPNGLNVAKLTTGDRSSKDPEAIYRFSLIHKSAYTKKKIVHIFRAVSLSCLLVNKRMKAAVTTTGITYRGDKVYFSLAVNNKIKVYMGILTG